MLKWLILLILIAIFALGLLGYLDPVIAILSSEQLTFKFGKTDISLYAVLRGLVAVILLFWIASIISSVLGQRLKVTKGLSATNRAILTQLITILIYIAAFFIGIDLLGIDLTTLAIFSGAIGIGLGFGLQKITSNFVSGIILLIEKSVEQDDLVEMSDGTSGFVRNNGARYTLIETFDGKEVMVPNEDFITNRVTNLTFTNLSARITIPVGVAYGSDLDKVREILLRSAKSHPSCSRSTEPTCFLREFGDSSINFILHFWIDDVTKGRYQPQSDVMFTIWHAFEENGIEIPFPQRDIHLKNELSNNNV